MSRRKTKGRRAGARHVEQKPSSRNLQPAQIEKLVILPEVRILHILTLQIPDPRPCDDCRRSVQLVQEGRPAGLENLGRYGTGGRVRL